MIHRDKGTVVRTVSLVIVWVNVWLEQVGLNAIPVVSEETIALGITTVVNVWTWFKNNYITLKGKQQREELKDKGLVK
ncbi:phage holin [Gracilibacillus massiliensis]|uniref:phage holin n=1 Tax=Gracilibacillus massiliensis TaxID=1564956 RepID=UPI00097C2F4B|nr:phage holin [Gracilibacillus massiliensis]